MFKAKNIARAKVINNANTDTDTDLESDDECNEDLASVIDDSDEVEDVNVDMHKHKIVINFKSFTTALSKAVKHVFIACTSIVAYVILVTFLARLMVIVTQLIIMQGYVKQGIDAIILMAVLVSGQACGCIIMLPRFYKSLNKLMMSVWYHMRHRLQIVRKANDDVK